MGSLSIRFGGGQGKEPNVEYSREATKDSFLFFLCRFFVCNLIVFLYISYAMYIGTHRSQIKEEDPKEDSWEQSLEIPY